VGKNDANTLKTPEYVAKTLKMSEHATKNLTLHEHAHRDDATPTLDT